MLQLAAGASPRGQSNRQPNPRLDQSSETRGRWPPQGCLPAQDPVHDAYLEEHQVREPDWLAVKIAGAAPHRAGAPQNARIPSRAGARDRPRADWPGCPTRISMIRAKPSSTFGRVTMAATASVVQCPDPILRGGSTLGAVRSHLRPLSGRPGVNNVSGLLREFRRVFHPRSALGLYGVPAGPLNPSLRCPGVSVSPCLSGDGLKSAVASLRGKGEESPDSPNHSVRERPRPLD